jgi:hypothetical protein
MFKLVSICLETKADAMLQVCECCGTMARIAVIFPALEIMQTGQASTKTVENYKVLPGFIFIGKLLHDLKLLIHALSTESPRTIRTLFFLFLGDDATDV